MSIGIRRNKFEDLLRIKGKKKISRKRFSKHSLNKTYNEDESYIKLSLLNPIKQQSTQIQMNQMQMNWMQQYQQCCHLLQEIQFLRTSLKNQKKKKISVIKSTKQQQYASIIQSLSQQIFKKINQCQQKLKIIQSFNNIDHSKEEKKILTNVTLSLASKIRSEARAIRDEQQLQLKYERQLGKYNYSNFDEQLRSIQSTDQSSWLDDDNCIDENTDENRLQTLLQKKIAQQNNIQVQKLINSITSLNEMYKDLQILVIQQGTLLDRIDQNLQITYETTLKANQHLKKAKKHQQSPCACRMIIIILVCIFISIFIMVIKHV